MSQEFIIKNMVCPRCIEAVENIFREQHIEVSNIRLGKVQVKSEIVQEQKNILSKALKKRGFELLDDKNTRLINQIKTLIINEIHYQEEDQQFNFSTLLSDALHYDYTYLSRLFSSVAGLTIEQFILLQKVERVKEFLTYDEMNLSEIAFQMNYSSTAHLSSQFKKITGMTPSQFKKLQDQERKFIDDL